MPKKTYDITFYDRVQVTYRITAELPDDFVPYEGYTVLDHLQEQAHEEAWERRERGYRAMGIKDGDWENLDGSDDPVEEDDEEEGDDEDE